MHHPKVLLSIGGVLHAEVDFLIVRQLLFEGLAQEVASELHILVHEFLLLHNPFRSVVIVLTTACFFEFRAPLLSVLDSCFVAISCFVAHPLIHLNTSLELNGVGFREAELSVYHKVSR